VRKVLCDNGCSTTLLPLEDDQIISLFLKFPMEGFLISVVKMSSSAGRTSVLQIEYIDLEDFHVKLCQDLAGNCVSMSVEVLTFALCSSDIKTILQTPALLERLTQQDAANLRRAAVEQAYHKRRTHAVLGMSVLKKLSSIRHSSIKYYVDPKKYELTSWPELSAETKKILEQIKLPECFEDWEDDENYGRKLCYDFM
jgi:hypothetical protein